MFSHRLSIRKLAIWAIICLQVFAITSYYYLHDGNTSASDNKSVQFLHTNHSADSGHILQQQAIHLNTTLTRSLYNDFNSSLCYHNGTDIKRMQRNQYHGQISWKCECLPDFHGTDCSQPEVIWRALLAYRKPVALKIRKEERKVLYVFELNELTMTIADIRISELNHVVDLFVLYEVDSNRMETQVRFKFLKDYPCKILYLHVHAAEVQNLWQTISKCVRNIRNDDIIVYTGHNEVPNLLALKFLKLYDVNEHAKLLQPFQLRYRWSVFGFFWLHPNRTKLVPTVATVKYVTSELNGNLVLLQNQTNGFIIGDLNHYGGWFCEFCNDPGNIIRELTMSSSKVDNERYKSLLVNGAVKLNNLSKNQVIDVNTIEDLIENGIYMDGKVDLIKANGFRDLYFAPKVLQDNTWKYDYLMVNIYSKMDYYE